MKKEIIIPLTLIICSLILGGSYYGVQANKQSSIEKQQQIEMIREREIEEAKKMEERKNKAFYDWCVQDAENTYWSFMELNGTKQADGSIWALNRFWDSADKTKKENINNCVIRYLK